MYGNRTSPEFLNGIDEFRGVALEYKRSVGCTTIFCPCRDCQNIKRWEDFRVIEDHLFLRGFKEDYVVWFWHGEKYECNLDKDGDSLQDNNSANERGVNLENVPSGEDQYDDEDRVSDMMDDLRSHLGQDSKVFERVEKAAETPLYPGCSKYSKLSALLALFNLKAEGNWTDSSFTRLLELLADMFPEGNDIPTSTYYAKKLMCPLGLDYVKIDACPNDCLLYRNEYEGVDLCPKCGLSRYKESTANEEDEDADGEIDGKRPERKRIHAKVVWHLPIIPRLIRLFSIKKDSENLRWHAVGRKKDGKIRHPADAKQWKEFDKAYPEFASDDRNLRIALCTDGMNPYASQSSLHSSWPVVCAIYNLPSWLCMKRKYLMMPLLITGPKQPGHDIDVYLAPLVDEFKQLWAEGVRAFDAHTNSYFTLRAMLFCTVNDFPAYGNLSGYKVKGEQACPICEDDMIPVYLKKSRKNVYVHHRRFLDRYHPYRKKKTQFDGTVELGVAREPFTGTQVYERIKDVETTYGKTIKRKSQKGVVWKKLSILYSLPYWKDLDVRHCLDVMHIEKNVCDSLVGTLLQIPGKTKDSLAVRNDMKELGIRTKLWPIVSPRDGISTYLPPPCYAMSTTECKLFAECLRGVKVPSGYCSNLKGYVTPSELKMSSMKSHDCHIMMQVFLPIAVRGLLPDCVRDAVIKLCLFFNAICRKVIDETTLDALQNDVVHTLCKFEMYFPPSFFDIMVHLTVHLVREVKYCGPVFLRWMYPFERHFKELKDKNKNMARPEASIVRGYIAEEIAEFCAEFLARANAIGVPGSRHEGRLRGKGTIGCKLIRPPLEPKNKAHLYVLQTLSEVHPYVERHKHLIRSKYPKISDWAMMQEHNRNFQVWFNETVMHELADSRNSVPDTVRYLARGPRPMVISYEGYDINGYSFYTNRQDNKSSVLQNSGVVIMAASKEFASAKDGKPVDASMHYYGVIEEIWELDYMDFTVPVFRCKWADNRRGLKTDRYGFTLVDTTRFRDTNEPFILGSHAKQVFYVEVKHAHKDWSVVVEGKRQILGVEGVVDEDEFDEFDEPLALSMAMESQPEVDNFETVYMRQDLGEEEGTTIPIPFDLSN